MVYVAILWHCNMLQDIALIQNRNTRSKISSRGKEVQQGNHKLKDYTELFYIEKLKQHLLVFKEVKVTENPVNPGIF